MALTKHPRRTLSTALVVLGAGLMTFGIALVYVPAALVVSGLALSGVGLLVIEVE